MRREPPSADYRPVDTSPLFGRLSDYPERQRAAEAATAAAGADWHWQAQGVVLAFAKDHPSGWLTEEVVAHAGTYALLPQPPDRRAWGSVVSGLARRGLLVRCGFGTDGYGSPKPMWKLAT